MVETAGNEWPMEVETFLGRAEQFLERGDVVLCRGRKSIFSRLIRWSTRSHFSHSGLIFLIPKRDQGFNNTFMIESVPSGVDVTDLRHYLIEHADGYDIAIKRLEQPWFNADRQRMVRGHMLDFIKADYDFATIWNLAVSIIRRLIFSVQVRRKGLEASIRHVREKNRLAPAQFICSGFVQYGYFGTVKKLIEEGDLPTETLEDILFKPGLSKDASVAAILSVTPQDLSNSDKLHWLYVGVNGLVHRVRTEEDVNRLLGIPTGIRG